MTSSAPAESAAGAPTSSAGSILRQARKAKGLHLAAIAATIKVAPAKLEALENDRFDQLPDATFTRALAQAMCRVLHIDAQPVLARLPQGAPRGLERLEGGLKQPFHERPGQTEPRDWSALRSPAVWGPALLVLGAVLLLLVPLDALRPRRAAPSSEVEAGAASAAPTGVVAVAASATAASAASAATEASPASAIVDEAPRAGPSAVAAAPAAEAAASGVSLELQASGETWVEVRDARGQVLISRTLHKGENVRLDTAPPLRVRIGNAKDTRLVFRGRAIDPSTTTRDNIARLELP